MKKQQLIRKINKLDFGSIIYGYKEGELINLNEYDEVKDVFRGYDKDCKLLELKYEEVPSILWIN